MTLSGSPVDYLFVFLGGLLLSLTPCVYPLIPVTAGYIGGVSGGSKLRGFFLSLIYVTGIAFTYSILGLVASLTGQIFGRISTSPITNLSVGIIIFIFGLSMSGVFEIRVPNFTKTHTVEHKGYFSSFLLGLVSGFIISPCVSPVLGAILVYLAKKHNVFYGTTLLFVFAYGMGAILILVGTSSSFLANLPKTGKWLMFIKKTAALVLIIMGLYFIYTAIRRF